MPVSENIVIKQLDLELNGGCNYTCPMCPQTDGREKDFLKKLPYGVFTKIIDDALQYELDTVSLHGSGEPTLNRDMAKYVEYVKSKNVKCLSFTNGYRLSEDISRELIEAGIDTLRISCIGYDRESYAHWMSLDTFDEVRANVKRFVDLNAEMGGHSEVHIHHLVTNIENKAQEIELYRQNWSEYTGARSEIWLMHNWAGSEVELGYHREAMAASSSNRRSCGRPFSPLLQVRAGGLVGHTAAVVACCMVLGKDSEAVLGHLDTQTIAEVVAGSPYSDLRDAHSNMQFDDISYCANCDQLYDLPESLVWTNIEGREYGQSKVVADMDHRTYS
ncbi:MAG: radical SAM protein [Rhodospirillaceae bacterium]|nr:radical SAM protein [Rhodospirillaceae bacterium]